MLNMLIITERQRRSTTVLIVALEIMYPKQKSRQ